MKNISKIGLLEVAIPKTWDTIHAGNNQFTIHITYSDGSDQEDFHAQMPLLNYYPVLPDLSPAKIDDPLSLDADGNKEDNANAGSADRVNIVEAIMFAMNEAFAAGAIPAPLPASPYRCVVYLCNGRLTMAVGYGHTLAGAGLAANGYSSQIATVAFTMNKRLAVFMGAHMEQPGDAYVPEQR